MDPSLDDAAARLTESVRRSFETLKSAKVGESVSPLVSGLFGDCLEWIAADGGTLWWLSPGDGVRCARPVELLAIYPSLLAAAGLPAVDSDRHLEGLSLLPWIGNPEAPRQRLALTTLYAGNHSLCDDRYRYTRYADGSEELYDRHADPHEFDNRIEQAGERPELRAVIGRLSAWIPKQEPAPPDLILNQDPGN